MKKIEATLNNKTGLHARPASMFVKEASKYSSDIRVIKDGQEYNAKSIMGILGMGATMGTRLTITAEGSDEREAVTALKNMIDSNFGE